MKLRLLLAAPLCLLSGVAAQAAAPLPQPLVPVVLKVDDLVSTPDGGIPPRWKRITDFAQERKIKLSIGIITKSLEGDKPVYFAWLRQLQATGLVQFWFHGYDHGVHQEADGKSYAEFADRPYEEQKRRFDLGRKLAIERLGAPFTTYGQPGGGNTQRSDADWATSARVVAETPGMRIWLYPTAIDAIGQKLQAAGKVTILDRVWQVNIEMPIFKPNSQAFIAAYSKYAAGRRYYILQGHPNQWSDAGWAEFVKLVDYLQQNHIPIVTPDELVASLSAAKP